MAKFQVSVTLSTSGYLTVEALNAKEARKQVRALEVGLNFGCTEAILADPS